MALDLSNPAVVAEARRVATNIKNAVGVADLEARRADVRARSLTVEQNYRRAELEVSQAARALSDLKQALRDRGEELVNVAAEETKTETRPRYGSDTARKAALAAALKTDAACQAIQTEIKAAEVALKAAGNDDKPACDALLAAKRAALVEREAALVTTIAEEKITEDVPRYGTADAKSAGAITLRKTDVEYLAIKAEIAKAEQSVWGAEGQLTEAKAAQRDLEREATLLVADTQLATARINAFAGLDAPASASQGPAPVPTPAPAAAVA